MPLKNPNHANRRKQKTVQIKVLPAALRAKGIITQYELIMALLPYMEWVPYRQLLKVFWKYIDHRDDRCLRYRLQVLETRGLVERKFEGTPPTPTGGKVSPYLYVRRVAKSCPRDQRLSASKLDGTYGRKAEQERRARANAKPKPPPKTTMKNLTHDDLKYIRENALKMCYRELGEMYGIHIQKVFAIRHGHTPAHLRGPRVQ